MKRFTVDACIVVTVLTTLGFAATTATAQMGLRENDLFASRAFDNVGPAIGSLVPELDLTDLDGNPVTLESYRGQVVVLVKGGFT
ncbi:peroxiredoxin family protein [bacterium]|nr:peroxiredoxin family protein [bacterium]